MMVAKRVAVAFLSFSVLLAVERKTTAALRRPSHGETIQVQVGVAAQGGPTFRPSGVVIQPGDTVQWIFGQNDGSTHNVTSGADGITDRKFASGTMSSGSFSFTFSTPGKYAYFCAVHFGCCAESGVITVADPGPTPAPTPTGPVQFLNLSTRLNVQTGDNVMIGGFIVTGTAAKKVLLRATGPSLIEAGIIDALADPVLELRSSGGALIASNDNWKDTQVSDIEETTIPPTNDLESAIVATLPANNAAYTAIVRGNNSGMGIGLVEIYDLDSSVDSKLANISTRGWVQTGSDVMIGGFILGNGGEAANVLVRGIGPSLAQAGVTMALTDPILELRDDNGSIVQSNDNWKDSQQVEIQATGAAPANELEAALIATLPAGTYTAAVAGKNGGVGVALVELFNLQ